MRSKEFDVVHDQGNQHTISSIEGSWENSILVAKPHHAVEQRKDHMTGKQTRKSMPHINIWSRPKHASTHRSLMIPLLGNVARTQDHPWRLHTSFRPWLTNRCSGSRVGEDRRCRSPQLGISMTSQPRGYRSLEPSRDLVPRTSPTNKFLEEGSKVWSLY